MCKILFLLVNANLKALDYESHVITKAGRIFNILQMKVKNMVSFSFPVPLLVGSFVLMQSSMLAAQDLSLDISPKVAHDYNLDKNGTRIPISLTDKNLATYAWNTFFALNFPSYPIDSGKRGTLDPSKKFGDSGPTIWNTFKEKRELFRIALSETSPTGFMFNTSDPGSFDSLIGFDQMSPNVPPCKGVNPIKPNEVWNFLDESQEIGLATIWAWDKVPNNNNLIRTQVKMNREYFNYVRANQFYNTSILNEAISTHIDPVKRPFGPVSLPIGNEQNEGAILIKTSWIRTGELPDFYQGKYYNVRGLYYDDFPNGEGACYRADNFSLIAIHIIHKTRSFPQFLYTTFENAHNRELPLFYANANGTASTLPNAYNYTYRNPANPQPGLQDPPYPVHYDINPPRPVVSQVNVLAREMIADQFPQAVWQNYQLVGLQFAAANGPWDPINNLQDFYLANPVVETSQRFQRFTGTFNLSSSVNVAPHPYQYTNRVQMGGCMGCHGAGAQGGPYTPQEIAQGQGGTDFSFILFAARFNPNDQGVETLLNPALRQISPGQTAELPPWLKDLPDSDKVDVEAKEVVKAVPKEKSYSWLPSFFQRYFQKTDDKK